MAELITVARPYAEAAFRSALEAGELAAWSDSLQVAAAVAANEQMAATLLNPKVSTEQKKALFLSVLGTTSAGMKNLIDMLLDRHRSVLIGLIAAQFESLKRAHESKVKARIVTAFPMSTAEQAEVVQALAKKFGRSVEAETVVDASLIGGVRIEIGDEVIHASVRDTLDRMAIALAS